MSGYTPVFSSVFDGTLHGRWPHTGVWVCLLAMADKHGCVDMVPRKIASDIGIEVEELLACIADFCAPDPDSRTIENDGRRLELIDVGRPWGWRILNHGKYREKARKAASDAERVASGAEAERKRQERLSRDVPRCPDAYPAVPPSDSDSDSDTNSDSDSGKDTSAAHAARAQPPDDRFAQFRQAYPKRTGSQPWDRARKAISARLAQGSTWAEILEGTARYSAFCQAAGKVGTEFVMQAATFCGPDRHFLEPWKPPASRQQTKQDANVAASVAWLDSRP